jgi:hypothetical protein
MTAQIKHGSDLHLALIGSAWHLQLLDEQDQADMLAFGRACMEVEREWIAAHFDSRDKGAGGFYDPHEPAKIIRALGRGLKLSRPEGLGLTEGLGVRPTGATDKDAG